MEITSSNQKNSNPGKKISSTYDIVIIGGGTAGIASAASLLKRRPNLSVAIIEPNENHYYQPSWTLVGRGVFDIQDSIRPTRDVIPNGAVWIRNYANEINPDNNQVTLRNGDIVEYRYLVACPGLRLAWEKIEGLEEALGKNGVTSNYRVDLAPYTWELVSNLKSGNVLFTQPAMPIKCAGAPQKALYLSCDHWLRKHRLNNINVDFHNAGGVLFGVPEFVPPLMKYIEKYNAHLNFNSNLVRVDGKNKIAWFDTKDAEGNIRTEQKSFDMLHAVPPQAPPAVISTSKLADAAGWCEIDPTTLRHVRYTNVFSLGDVSSTPNAKTAAAARKQVVIVAENLLASMDKRPMRAIYDGYGSCPLTVEKGKIILAEFGYKGKLLPTFPLDPTKPRYLAWVLKAKILPWVYWNCMLKGREWLTKCSAPLK